MTKIKHNKKAYLETYGCQMNEYDSELVKTIIKDCGYDFVDSYIDANLIMLNTCSVREHAHDVVFNRIFKMRSELKDKDVKIAILGCMATSMKNKLLIDHRLNLDFIAGPDSYKKIPYLLKECEKEKYKASDYSLSDTEVYEELFPTRKDGVNAWVAIMRGCNNFCSYCIVPYTRGVERSRSPKSILKEIEKLVNEGFKQVTLLGQNVNSYMYEDFDFTKLILAINEIKDLKRIRFVSPHPKDFKDDLINAIASNHKICNHIHLPLQSGNDRILQMMNRKYTSKMYLDLVDRIKMKIPDVTLTTDIITSFPTETEEEFEDTINLVKKVQFDSAFIFKYSERKGTYAYNKFKDDISEETKTKRIIKINDIQRKISVAKNKAHAGKIEETMVELLYTKKSTEDFQGRNDGNKLVIFPKGAYQIGDIVNVKIEEATSKVLIGEVIEKSDKS